MNTPKEQWPITNALIFSVDWAEPLRDEPGHYAVIYSYRVGEERYTGQFRDYTSEQDDYLHHEDVISIRYCPEHPSKSFYPEADDDGSYGIGQRLVAFSIGGGITLIGILIVYYLMRDLHRIHHSLLN